jgi:hypothetical protein
MGVMPKKKTPHERLLSEYVVELKAAMRLAKAARAKDIKAAVAAGMTGEDAGAELDRSQGPAAAHPKVLGLIVKYYFRCRDLNDELKDQDDDESFEDPMDFVHELLADYDDLYDFLAELPYLPLGLRKDDSRV